jgi:two-component system sensor histidine kinase BaeS
MFNKLRTRLMLSHILILLIVGPLVGIALVYLIETQVLLTRVTSDLTDQATTIATLTSDDTVIWQDKVQAELFLRILRQITAPQITVAMFDADGQLLSSTSPVVSPPDLTPLLSGRTNALTSMNRQQQTDTVSVLIPVNSDGRVIGVLQLTRDLTEFSGRFTELRLMVTVVLLGGLLVGAVVGILLSVTMESPIASLTRAANRLTEGDLSVRLPVRGPRELRQLSQAFNTLVEQMQMLESTRRRLLANLVHELGRPLGAMLAGLQALQGGAIDDKVLRQDLLYGMQDEIERLRHLLNDLAGLYDKTLGAMEITREPLDLGTWLPGVLAPWREAAIEKGLEWQSTIPDSLPVISADANRLAQVLGNLLSNAIKFTPSGKRVSVEASTEDHTLTLVVRDTGPGIPPAEQEHIFEPFHRAGNGKRFPQGMGLGLTIARDIAIAHGGSLTLTCSSSEGSEFTLRLPL